MRDLGEDRATPDIMKTPPTPGGNRLNQIPDEDVDKVAGDVPAPAELDTPDDSGNLRKPL
jgi:hypothetical protein